MAPKLLTPGFHSGLDMDRYLAERAVSNSWLGTLKQAPALLWAQLNEPAKAERPETPATILGTAIHAAILEPDVFRSTYTKAKPCEAEMKSGARKGQACGAPGRHHGPEEGWCCGKHKPITRTPGIVLSAEEYECCLGLRDNALTRKAQFHNPTARKLLKVKGAEIELTGRWDDGPTGEPAKLRGDHVADLVAACSDVKSCLDASPAAFAKTFYDRRYYAQQSHYNMGFTALARPMRSHYVIAAEKRYPYLVAVYRVVDDVLALGREEVRQLLDLYHECVTSGVWPGYPPKVMDIALPYWGEKQLRAAIEMEV